MTVSIKPLEWREEPVPPCGETLAPSVVGLYCIPHSGDRFYLRFRDAMTLGDYSTLDKAKAAAQADYEARIRSALSAQVQDVAESAFQAIADERLRQIGKGYDAAHDDRHVAGEIISATWGASARLWDAQECAVSGDIAGYKKYLVQAAAQIVAEYGRVERAAAPAKQEG